jgi:hypothetical protein
MPSRRFILLLLLLAAASGVLLFGHIGIALTVVLVLVVWRARNQKPLGTMRADLPLILVIGLVFVAIPWVFVRAALSTPREARSRTFCADHLRQIAVALYEYRQDYGSFPPAYVADRDGRPMHSWRVLILPYLRCQSLYKRYDFSEPWDGPNNKKLLASCPWAYICPSDTAAASPPVTCTNYVAVVGPGAAWSGVKPTRIADVTPRERTVMLIEAAGGDVAWTEPRDFSLDPDAASSPGRPTISSNHVPPGSFFHVPRPKVHVILADGNVQLVPADVLTGPDSAALLRVGGFPPEYIDKQWPVAEDPVNRLASFCFPIWLAAVSLLLFLSVQTRKQFAAHERSPIPLLIPPPPPSPSNTSPHTSD